MQLNTFPCEEMQDSSAPGIRLCCPACRADLGVGLANFRPALDAKAICGGCGFEFDMEDGIWRALTQEQRNHFALFLQDYEYIRSREGRGSASSNFYLSLPYEDTTGNNSTQWRIRGLSYRHFEKHILPGIEGRVSDRPLTVLDLGAGNGWLSYRLALRGHTPVAVDLIDNRSDGLGAAQHYKSAMPDLFSCMQADMDALPFQAAQFDCAIFNASFHYSQDYMRTLGEACRCVRPGGAIVIMDSPWYSDASHGQVMVAERRAAFKERYGFASDRLGSRDFLIDADLRAFEQQLSLRFTRHTPWYGIRWALRPHVARLKGKREPSTFRIYVAEIPPQ